MASNGLSVTQLTNSKPSVFFSPLPAFDVFLEGAIQVGAGGNWDDDFIGFVLGFEAGDTSSATADFLLIDWKQANQDFARRGLAVSRVTGPAEHVELWRHTGHVTELARAATLGDTGWLDGREYRFRFEYSPTRLRLWVDDQLEVDLGGTLPEGSFGFYNFSQQSVRYRGFSTGLAQQFEGETFEIRAPFRTRVSSTPTAGPSTGTTGPRAPRPRSRRPVSGSRGRRTTTPRMATSGSRSASRTTTPVPTAVPSRCSSSTVPPR